MQVQFAIFPTSTSICTRAKISVALYIGDAAQLHQMVTATTVALVSVHCFYYGCLMLRNKHSTTLHLGEEQHG